MLLTAVPFFVVEATWRLPDTYHSAGSEQGTTTLKFYENRDILRVDSLRFLIRDRDAKYSGSFDAVFAADGIETLKTAPRAPRMNARCERVIGTLRREALDHLLIWNETHARRVLDAHAHHYNQHRPHQARGQLPPLAEEHPAPVTDLTSHLLLRTRVLGGAINEYRYAA